MSFSGRVVAILLGLLTPVALAMGGQEPTACVFEHVDQWTKSAKAAELLEQAGFHVRPLSLDRSAADLDVDLIFIGSFASEHPQYGAYMAAYAEGLYHFVDHGHTLVQMTQADQVEPEPPFLPSTHGARRCDRDFQTAYVLSPEHPLLRGIESTDKAITLHPTRTIWESFNEQGGFEVILAGDDQAQFPALMEGAYGQGRIVLSAMAFDKVITPIESVTPEMLAGQDALARAFFRNLAGHVVRVRDRNTVPLNITPSPRGAKEFVPGAWTLVVLPDTQVYSLRFPGLFTAQTGWILQNRQPRNIQYVVQLGDIVNNNTPREWANARAALRLLDGVVPYALCPGNHDYGPSGDASQRNTLLNEYFPFDEISRWPTFGGAMEKGRLDNTYHLFETGDVKWIILALEWAPRDETVAWANDVMSRHPDHSGILITHAFVNNNDRRYDITDTEHPQDYNPHQYRTPGSKNDGQQLWDKLVRKHNFALVLNGHVLGDGTGYVATKNDRGRTVHQILSNYQMRELGGEAYLRLLEFDPDGKTVLVKTYSPLYDSYMLAPDQHFEIRLR
ncbi:MAG: metallophosphoesterase [Phycisphaerae bacterium]|nr:metallophosphoesterase [Phycisphaerae bacterium]